MGRPASPAAAPPANTRRTDRGFRWRSHEITRIEGFSDAVLAFAVTLLVVSLEVPESFHELRESMQGFIAFALGFALLFWVWYNQYIFFRRYAMNDGWTLTLNGGLLFVVLFFVYPLKFLFVTIIKMISGVDTRVPNPDGTLHAAIGPGEGVPLMVIYGAGYAAIFAIFWMMYRHALKNRAALGLDEVEVLLTRSTRRGHLINIAIAVASILVVLVGGDRWSGIAGLTYVLVGPLMTLNGTLAGRSLRRHEARAAQPVQSPDDQPNLPTNPAQG
jgi:uncharacterized membrane protein